MRSLKDFFRSDVNCCCELSLVLGRHLRVLLDDFGRGYFLQVCVSTTCTTCSGKVLRLKKKQNGARARLARLELHRWVSPYAYYAAVQYAL